MAIDQTNVALDIASKAVAKAGQLVDALADLEELYKHGQRAGLNMVDYDAAFEASDLKHVNGATLNKLLAVVTPAFRAWLVAQTSGADTYEAILYKARR